MSEKSMYNVINTLVTPFLIGSFSFLQVRSLKEGQPYAQLAALEHLEKSPRHIMGEML